MDSLKISSLLKGLKGGAKAKPGTIEPSDNSITPKVLEGSTRRGNTKFSIAKFDDMGAFGTVQVENQDKAFHFTYTTTNIYGTRNQSISLRTLDDKMPEVLTVRANAKKVLPQTIKALEQAVHDLIILHKA